MTIKDQFVAKGAIFYLNIISRIIIVFIASHGFYHLSCIGDIMVFFLFIDNLLYLYM